MTKKKFLLSFLSVLLLICSFVYSQNAGCEEVGYVYTVNKAELPGGPATATTDKINIAIPSGSCLGTTPAGETIVATKCIFYKSGTSDEQPGDRSPENNKVNMIYLNDKSGATAPINDDIQTSNDVWMDVEYTGEFSEPVKALYSCLVKVIAANGGKDAVVTGPPGRTVVGGYWGTSPDGFDVAGIQAHNMALFPEAFAPGPAPGGEETSEGDPTCKEKASVCKDEDECLDNNWYWWDDKCHEEKEPECNLEDLEECKTEEECLDAKGTYWDSTEKKCKICLSECTSQTEGNPLTGACCDNKCSPSAKKNISITGKDCIEEGNDVVYYRYSCDGTSGNAIATKEGTCNGTIQLKAYYKNSPVTTLISDKEYYFKLEFSNKLKSNQAITLKYGAKADETPSLLVSNFKCNSTSTNNIYSCYADGIQIENDLSGKMVSTVDAKTDMGTPFYLLDPNFIIDTKKLATPTVKISKI